jgi:electron transport complex protein RnfC
MAEQHTIWSFHGGLHLDDHKEESNQRPVQDLPLPRRLILPLQQ